MVRVTSVFTLKMRIFLVLFIAVGLSLGQDANGKLRTEYKDYGDGTYYTIVERYDGSRIYSAGWVKNPEEEDVDKRKQVMVGYFGHVANGGFQFNTTYLSDENGYQVDGNHLNEAQRLPDHVYTVVDNVREGRGIGIPVDELRRY